MKLNLLTFALIGIAGIVSYERLPDLTYELRHGWQAWQVTMVLESAMASVGAFWILVCVAVLVAEWVTRRRA